MAKKKSKRTPGKKVVRKSHVKKPGRKSGVQPSGNAEVTRAIELLQWAHDMTGKLAAGFDESDVDTVLWRNPVEFYGQSGRLDLSEVDTLETATFEGNSVLRGARKES